MKDVSVLKTNNDAGNNSHKPNLNYSTHPFVHLTRIISKRGMLVSFEIK